MFFCEERKQKLNVIFSLLQKRESVEHRTIIIRVCNVARIYIREGGGAITSHANLSGVMHRKKKKTLMCCFLYGSYLCLGCNNNEEIMHT